MRAGENFGYSTDLETFVKGERQEEMEGTQREIEQPGIAKDQM